MILHFIISYDIMFLLLLQVRLQPVAAPHHVGAHDEQP